MSTNGDNSYCHVTPGRVRVRVTNLKNNRAAAKSLQVLLASQPGIKHVCANPVTGNVLVTYAPDMLSHCDILESLIDLGHIPMTPSGKQAVTVCEAQMSEIGMRLAKVALKHALAGTPAAILMELF